MHSNRDVPPGLPKSQRTIACGSSLWLSVRTTWFKQAEADLRLARTARDAGHYEWSAFACQQGAEKAVKALYQHLHKDAWGHVLIALLGALPEQAKPDDDLMDRARVLDRHYIPTRYQNGFERGAPVDFYSQKDASEAIANAEAILAFCRNQIG